MSIIFPYTPDVVISFYSSLFSLDLTTLNNYQVLVLTIASNLYFFVYWFIIIYFSLKIFNRIWERMF